MVSGAGRLRGEPSSSEETDMMSAILTKCGGQLTRTVQKRSPNSGGTVYGDVNVSVRFGVGGGLEDHLQSGVGDVETRVAEGASSRAAPAAAKTSQPTILSTSPHAP